ncbi:hypothetical protein [Elstera cyanobacteriorum]|uniref:hypothetical protein n=1 Tax=Elstera cyanobacteriorum TaxID=2022747 RepID=UPI0023520D17|nr:hypothetical protein [Elstera cyanobacteriorum]MCK6444502.1 hypothetical protein [Elstera cyanobacteriorum]
MTDPSKDTLGALLRNAAPPTPDTSALEARIIATAERIVPMRAPSPRRPWLLPAAALAASLLLGLMTGYALTPGTEAPGSLPLLAALTPGHAELLSGWFGYL